MQHQHEVAAANTQHQADVALQTDQQRETALTSYIQNIKDLISTEMLDKSKSGDEVRVIARAQTLITLRKLDGTRKGIMMQFLWEAGLITKSDVIIDLAGADLRGAVLLGVGPRGANLLGADLLGADLLGADLRGANLRGAIITQQQIDEAITCYQTFTDEGITHSQQLCVTL